MSSHEQSTANADPKPSRSNTQQGATFRSVVRCSTCKKHRQKCAVLRSKSRSKSTGSLACTMCTAKSLGKSCDIEEMIVRAHDKQSQGKRKDRQQGVQSSEEAEKDIEGDTSTQSKIDDYFDWLLPERSSKQVTDDLWNTRLPPLEGQTLTAFSQLNAANNISITVAPFRQLAPKSPASPRQSALPVPHWDAHMSEGQESSLFPREDLPEYRGTMKDHPVTSAQQSFASNGVFSPAEASAVYSQPECMGVNDNIINDSKSLESDTELASDLTWSDLLIDDDDIPDLIPE